MRTFFLFLLFPFFSLFSLSGIEYRQITSSIHVIEIDPLRYEIKPVKALDNGIGRESVLSIHTRYGALASINGGFFSIGGTFDGKACGTLKIHDWVALPAKPRGCIGWSSSTPMPRMDRLWVEVKAEYDGTPFSVDGLNRPRKEGEIVVYNPCFHRTTLTNPDGEEVVVVEGVIQSVVKGGSTKIPEKGFVLSIHEKHPLFHSFKEGKPLTVETQIQSLTGFSSSDDWASLEYIVGGTPLLLYNGVKITDYAQERTIPTFLSNRHARTSVGVLPNGHWIFVVVDKESLFGGMTMQELADLMLLLGCLHALNLDGGGSSTMVYEGLVKNVPHGDEDEGNGQAITRRVSDAIVVLGKE